MQKVKELTYYILHKQREIASNTKCFRNDEKAKYLVIANEREESKKAHKTDASFHSA